MKKKHPFITLLTKKKFKIIISIVLGAIFISSLVTIFYFKKTDIKFQLAAIVSGAALLNIYFSSPHGTSAYFDDTE
jgi:Na+-translocating ferredoxin:NAD+ oxidoreductase RnfD subunit